jgi:formylglycine-generating enzyme required for sulfatase activity
VAATDTYGLYHTWMDYDADPGREGCNIERSGVSGSYTYSVAADWADRPVNYVSWADAVRFANWLHNGQPTGAQDLNTTEDGSYFINGASEFDDGQLEVVVREPDATWVVPTDDEWYKAAYHKNDGVTGNYWNWPTGTDSFAPFSNDLVDPDPGHHATYRIGAGDYTVGSPYWRTEAGEHENSASPYGTFDQGGNVMEFTETIGMIAETRRMRGGSWNMAGTNLFVSEIDDVMHSSDQFNDLGFRLANLAEPSPAVPALSHPGLASLLLWAACVGALALRLRSYPGAR